MFYWQSDRPYSVEEIKEIFLDSRDIFNKEQLKIAAEAAMEEEVVLSDRINHGSVNIVCPFTTKSGKEAVIRAHPNQIKNEYFYAEREAMSLASTAGVHVPTTITIDDSRNVVPFDYMVTTRIPGIVMKPAVFANPSLYPIYLDQIGQQLALLHSVKTKGYGFFDNELAKQHVLIGQYSRNEDHFLASLDEDQIFHHSNPQYLGLDMIKRSFAYLRSNIQLAHCDTPTIVHNDIADWNTVVNGDRVTGILDWDECFSGDPVFDFATTSLFYTDDQMRMLKKGYERLSKLPPQYDSKFDLYLVRYIVSKSKIAIKQLNSRQNDFMKLWLANAVEKLGAVLEKKL